MDSESNVIEALINMVQCHPLLWNPQHQDYKDKQKCLMKWNYIGTQLNLDADAACKKFKNLKDSFRKSLDKPKSGQGAVNNKPYKYAQQLSFLLGTFTKRQTLTNLPQTQSTESSDNLNHSLPHSSGDSTCSVSFLCSPSSPDYDPVPKMRFTYSSASSPIPSLSQVQTALSASPSPDYEPAPKMRSTYPSVSSSPIPSLSRAQTALSPDSFISPCSSPIDPPPSCPPTSKPEKASQQFLKYIQAREEAAAAAAKPKHKVDKFLESLSEDLKSLPEEIWDDVSTEMFMLVKNAKRKARGEHNYAV
ncbi:hypothetical protein M8J75_005923 [Diaphorina citri]|nr:hypothetical protein M8J75_005923 [Diaphorina citri]KAI5744064.1 hypothetical protein M8J77_025367 [Diaphorina citri]KAI5752343.1 hypothetical protein M8J77_016132 [Diaphorina citri]